MFYALKMPNSKDKVKMVKMLLGCKEVDLGILDRMNNTCYHAHSDFSGHDEAAQIVEAAHAAQLNGKP